MVTLLGHGGETRLVVLDLLSDYSNDSQFENIIRLKRWIKKASIMPLTLFSLEFNRLPLLKIDLY